MARCFVMTGKSGPLYECDFAGKRDEAPRSGQFVLHASLDMVDEAVWETNATYLKAVDRFEELYISAYSTAGGVRLLLLHAPTRNEDGIRAFFTDVHELYLKVVLNPFYEAHAPITSEGFDTRVKALARKHLSL